MKDVEAAECPYPARMEYVATKVTRPRCEAVCALELQELYPESTAGDAQVYRVCHVAEVLLLAMNSLEEDLVVA